MTIKHRQILRKEILPCRCMRYVYEQDLDVLYCNHHSKIITGRLDQSEVEKLLRKLYTDPPFRPKPPSYPREHVEVKIVVGVMAIVVAVSILLGIIFYAIPDNSATIANLPPPPPQDDFTTWVTTSVPSLKQNGPTYNEPAFNWGLTRDISNYEIPPRSPH